MLTPAIKHTITYVLGAVTGVALGFMAQSYANGRQPDNGVSFQQAKVFAETFAKIKYAYYKETDNRKMMEDALKGMVGGLDPHSEYLSKKDLDFLAEDTKGEFGGLGMEITKKDGMLTIVSPIEDTPAERAGIQPGDRIVMINGEATRGMSTSKAVKLMRGKPGTSISITISRASSTKPIPLKLERAVIKIKSVRSKLLDNGIGYVKVSQFQSRTVEDLAKNLNELVKENKGQDLKGLILDLRNDPGGLLDAAVGVSSAFLPYGDTVVSTKGRNDKYNMKVYTADKKYYAVGDDKDPLSGLPDSFKKIPMAVIINSGSASASEIVTGALQDHARAVVVGLQSFGKGSVQTLIMMSDATAIKITTALYYTPNDRSIQAQGIVPDIEVKNKDDEFAVREADLKGHIDNPKGGDEVKGGELDNKSQTDANKVEKLTKEQMENVIYDRIMQTKKVDPKNDPQLKKALEIVSNPELYKESLGKFKPIEKEKLKEIAKKEKEAAAE